MMAGRKAMGTIKLYWLLNLHLTAKSSWMSIRPLKAYTVASDLSNLENRKRFEFSPTAQELLVKNGFVVVPDTYTEYYTLYETIVMTVWYPIL
jgi:hypothetical protein